MAEALRVIVKPAPRLARALRNLKEPRIRRVFTRALIRSALDVQTEAASNQIIRSSKGPVDAVRVTSRTGTLRRSIAVNRQDLPFAITIGSDLIYAPVHEFGSRKRNIPARPFLGPALDAVAPRFERHFLTELRKASDG